MMVPFQKLKFSPRDQKFRHNDWNIFLFLASKTKTTKPWKENFAKIFFDLEKKSDFGPGLKNFHSSQNLKILCFEWSGEFQTGKCTLVKIAEKNKLGHDTVF